MVQLVCSHEAIQSQCHQKYICPGLVEVGGNTKTTILHNKTPAIFLLYVIYIDTPIYYTYAI